MTDYPEHDKMLAVQDKTQAIGEFVEWLESQGVQLMVWREDLTDSRPTEPECRKRRTDDEPMPCDPARGDSEQFGVRAYWRLHCKHWQDPGREAGDGARQGICCRCGRGRSYEVTGIKAFVHEQRGIQQLLADWAGIDLRKIEAEKRAMLSSLRAVNAEDHGQRRCGGEGEPDHA